METEVEAVAKRPPAIDRKFAATMLPLAFALLPAGAAAAAQPGPFSTAHIVGNTLYLDNVRCRLDLTTATAFAPDVNVTGRNYLTPPPLAVHRGACDDGATKIVRAVVAHSRLDALIHTSSSLYSITTTLSTKASPIQPIAVASLPSAFALVIGVDMFFYVRYHSLLLSRFGPDILCTPLCTTVAQTDL